MDQVQIGWKNFIKICAGITDEKSLALLLELFLTADERSDIALRFLIIRELFSNKKTQREIAKDLHVSIAKITRGSNELKRLNKKLSDYLQEKISE